MKLKRNIVGRITYVPDFIGNGEHYVFETKYEDDDETEWAFDMAFSLVDVTEDGLKYGSGELISSHVLTKIRQWNEIGIRTIYWA